MLLLDNYSGEVNFSNFQDSLLASLPLSFFLPVGQFSPNCSFLKHHCAGGSSMYSSSKCPFAVSNLYFEYHQIVISISNLSCGKLYFLFLHTHTHPHTRAHTHTQGHLRLLPCPSPNSLVSLPTSSVSLNTLDPFLSLSKCKFKQHINLPFNPFREKYIF